jgi:hypothetical protein
LFGDLLCVSLAVPPGFSTRQAWLAGREEEALFKHERHERGLSPRSLDPVKACPMPPPPFSPDLCKIRKKHDFPQNAYLKFISNSISSYHSHSTRHQTLPAACCNVLSIEYHLALLRTCGFLLVSLAVLFHSSFGPVHKHNKKTYMERNTKVRNIDVTFPLASH